MGKEGKLIALKEDNTPGYSHAEKLHLFVDEILKENQCVPEDLDAVAVSKGPGSYTGLRIGVSAAKGLCFSTDIPLIFVPTLEVLARQISFEETEFVVPMLDARRMEVYTAGYQAGYTQVFETCAKILDESSYVDLLDRGKVTFIGNGVEKFETICQHSNAVFQRGRLPSSREMVAMADEKFRNGVFEDVAYFEPYYLKDFMAG